MNFVGVILGIEQPKSRPSFVGIGVDTPRRDAESSDCEDDM